MISARTRTTHQLTRNLGKMVDTGWPVLVCCSTRDFRGRITDKPVNEQTDRELLPPPRSAHISARVYRVHNIDETRQTLDMVSAIKGTRPPKVASPRAGLNHPHGCPETLTNP